MNLQEKGAYADNSRDHPVDNEDLPDARDSALLTDRDERSVLTETCETGSSLGKDI
jgi:hypothetical protein